MSWRRGFLGILLCTSVACASAPRPVPWPERPRLCYRGEIIMMDRPGKHAYASFTYKVMQELFFEKNGSRLVERQIVYSGQQVVWQKAKGLPLVFSMQDQPARLDYSLTSRQFEVHGATASGTGVLDPDAEAWTHWRTTLSTSLEDYTIESDYQLVEGGLRIERSHYRELRPCLGPSEKRLIAYENIRMQQVGMHECRAVFGDL